ncbi:MAG: glycosyltransferase family 39 protein [Polyangiales bacterium]
MTRDWRRIGKGAYAAAAAAIICASLWLRAPVLSSGFAVDDYAQLAMMKDAYPIRTPPLQLFTFSSGDPTANAVLRGTGFFPWWSHPQLRISMFRPIASALMWLDLYAFGDNAFAYHLHSALWWVAMVAMLAVLLRRILPDAAALLALLLFCADEAHGMLLGWIANRNAIVASAFCVLGLWALLCRAENGDRRFGLLALASFGLGLLTSECALGFLGYAALHELLRPDGTSRARRLAPIAALSVGYLVLRAGLGFGSHGSGMYIDPFGEAGAFFPEAARRFPVLMADLVLALHSSYGSAGLPFVIRLVERGLLDPAWLFDLRPLRELLIWAGLFSLVLFAALGVSVARRREGKPDLRWLVLGTPLAVLPSVSSLPESRLLVPALLGFCVVLAERVHASVEAWRARRSAFAPALGLAAASAFAAYHIALPSYDDFVEAGAGARLANAVRASILAPELDPLLGRDARVMLLSAADPTTTIYLPLIRRLNGKPGPRACQLLTSTFVPLQLTTLSPYAFELTRLSDAYTPGDAYAAAFNREPLHTGERFDSDWLHVTVDATVRGLSMRARYQIDLPLDDPQVVLLAQTPEGLRRLAFPPQGESVTLMPPATPYELAPP